MNKALIIAALGAVCTR